MKLFYDLHIHSCVSPCGDDEMTPNNIVNMAYIKGLDVISVTDHNTVANVEVVSQLAKKRGLLFIPGIEVQTKEEVHILCYFPRTDLIGLFDSELASFRTPIKNNSKIFGNQWIMDEEDAIVGEVEHALIMSLNISIEALEKLVKKYKGVIVPAHVNKLANSILVNLGFIPNDLDIHTVEIHDKSPLNENLVKGYKQIFNSDAHYLKDIHEPMQTFDLYEKSCEAVIDYLAGKV
ncbi:PHP domain-containing protein [Fusibacter bizertensis]